LFLEAGHDEMVGGSRESNKQMFNVL